METMVEIFQILWAAITSSGPIGYAVAVYIAFLFYKDRSKLYRFIEPYAHRAADLLVKRLELGTDKREAELDTAAAHRAAAEVLLAQIHQQAAGPGGLRTSGEQRALQVAVVADVAGDAPEKKPDQSSPDDSSIHARDHTYRRPRAPRRP